MRIRQFREDHWDRLPTIRLQKAVLDNFKSVEHGEIVFACGKKFVPYGTESDILGLYGQNGGVCRMCGKGSGDGQTGVYI